MAKIDLDNMNYTDLRNKDIRVRYISRLRTCHSPEKREEGFRKLIKFYLSGGNLGMTAYCYELLGSLNKACKYWAKNASKRIRSRKIGDFSDLDMDIDIALTHPDDINKTDMNIMINFLEKNKDRDIHTKFIYKKANKIYKAKSRRRKKNVRK
ncbi:MAG: hypothetical protein IB618_01105 [Candidatus Pacearchaeota archaeon]|nr:MAG: hypothetical protein IB618_01105 [Candidatus Pacearchaeota archaeon]